MVSKNEDADFETLRSKWSWEEDKLFENCLVEFPRDWETIAAKIGTKSAAEVEEHYLVLLEDINAIESGLIESPEYVEKDFSEKKQQISVQRKAARPWTPDEHRLFLVGLEKYGRGDWKSIARYVILTRNPAQVASHAQKYFERQDRNENQNKKRRSIFDNSIAEPAETSFSTSTY